MTRGFPTTLLSQASVNLSESHLAIHIITIAQSYLSESPECQQGVAHFQNGHLIPVVLFPPLSLEDATQIVVGDPSMPLGALNGGNGRDNVTQASKPISL